MRCNWAGVSALAAAYHDAIKETYPSEGGIVLLRKCVIEKMATLGVQMQMVLKALAMFIMLLVYTHITFPPRWLVPLLKQTQ